MKAKQNSPALLATTAAIAMTFSYSANATDEIIVTATRTGETSIQRTPLAVSAFAADTLDKAGVIDIENIAQITPGLTFSANGPWAISSIRGVGTNNVFAGGDPSVTVQVDGVYFARVSAGNIDFLDVERVEVLRGPQGTLYGRNAVGGTINVITKDPEEFEARARFTAGNYDLYRGEFAVAGPLAPERVYASLAGQISKRDGYIEQLVPGEEDSWDEDRWSLRGKLKFVLADNVDFTLAADYTNQDELFNNDTVRVVQPFSDGFAPGHFEVASDFENGLDLERWGVSGKFVWELSDQWAVTSTTAYRDSDVVLGADLDNSAAFVTHTVHFPEDQTQFTQELLLNGDLGPLNVVGGFFYFNEDVTSFFNNQFALFSIYQSNGIANETNSYAGFVQGTYQLTDALSVTAGVRYTKDKKDGVNTSGADFVDPVIGVIPDFPSDFATLPVTLAAGANVELDFDAFTPKFGLDYQINDDVFLYASVTRGFKSGGFNLLTDTLNLPTVTPVPYDEEKVWSYEAGLKLTIADGRGRFNVTGFYYDYEGLQVNQFLSSGSFGQAIFNAPGAEIFGVEVETSANLTEYLSVGGNVAYLSAEYDGSFLVPDDPNPVPGTLVDADGNKTNDAPEWSGNIYAELNAPIGDHLTGGLRIDASYKGDVFYTPSNNPLEAQDSYWLLNVGASVSTNDGRWTAGLRARNLTDEEYIARAVTLIGVTSARPGAPRTVLGYVELNF